MAVQAFVTKHNELLALEREAEIEQSRYCKLYVFNLMNDLLLR